MSEPLVDPTEPIVEPDPEPENNEELEALQRELDAAKLAKKKAESALESVRKENSQLKKATKTEAELLEEQKKEVEENARKYKTLMAGARAKNVLSTTGLSEDEYSPILELIIGEDEDKTEAIATELKSLLASQEKKLEKAIREKILKETPPPPGGKPPEGADPFEERIKKYERK